MLDWLQPLLDWVNRNPNWALAVVFITSAADALVVLGFLVPSAVILFAVGAMVALGALDGWPTFVSAAAGALVGDCFNFWIGRRYGARALESKLAQRHAGAVDISRRFFERHGRKGIFLGRFFGPVRPFVPMFAAMHGMRLAQFLFWAALASLIWATALLLPGVAVGASLGLAAEVATRLAVLLFSTVVLVWLLAWLTSAAVRYFSGHAESWVVGLLEWSHRHRRVGRLGEWLAEPDQPETPALLVFAVMLLAAGLLWLALLGFSREHPLAFDAVAWRALADLHTPLGLALAGALAHLGEAPVILATALALVLTLFGLRRSRAAAHAIAAVAFGVLIALGLRAGLQLPDPAQYLEGASALPRTRYSSSELVLATVVLGLIPVLLATRRGPGARMVLYGVAVVLIALIAGSQLYLGRQWLSIVGFSVVLGGAWVLVLAVGYRRHRAQPVRTGRLLPPVLLVFVAAATLFPMASRPLPLAGHGPPADGSVQDWWDATYGEQPAYRGDSAGRRRQPLNLQWVGALGQIERALEADGWRAPVPLGGANVLRYLAPHAPVVELPLPPQVHGGTHQALILVRPDGTRAADVIRLWPTAWRLDGEPLWIGSLSALRVRTPLGFAALPYTSRDFDTPMAALETPPPGVMSRRAMHPGAASAPGEWSGSVWLLRPAPASTGNAPAESAATAPAAEPAPPNP